MSSASRYWIQVKIDAAGNCRFEEILPAKAFFLESFPEFMAQNEVPDTVIQRQLLSWMQAAKESQTPNPLNLAERCLQCFISNQIEQACQRLASQFGVENGFTKSDLLPFVLDDDSGRQRQTRTTPASSYQSLQRDILESFNPDQSSLATWTSRRVKHHRELNAFLLEHGIYLVSDWAILNDTNPKQLQRIFSQFRPLTETEIQQASQLLESYHAVYRAQRLKQRQKGIQGQCLPPTTEQLNQIAQRLLTETTSLTAPQDIMAQLQEIASHLREYRIHVRGGSLPTESINAPNSDAIATSSIAPVEFIDNRDEPDEQTEFLLSYRQQFLDCLDAVLKQVTEERVAYLQRRDSEKAQKFLLALEQFHCQGCSMTDIAPIVNLPSQSNVSRLLQLKSFRADVRQRLLILLRDRVFDQAKAYINPERLQQIEEAIDEQITTVIEEGKKEASTATLTRTQNSKSLFAQRLCYLLDLRKTQP